MSVSDYVNSVRIDAAQRMVSATDLPMMTIALECGFHSQQYFYKVFKARHGISPTEYRKKFRG